MTGAADATDSRKLRLDVLARIGRVVVFDAYAWLLTDPETSVGAAPLADVPCLPELHRAIRLKYLTAQNRWTGLGLSGGDGAVALLHQATGGDLRRSRLWREMLCDYGVVDIASVVFRDQYGCWGFLDLWRTGSAKPFGPEDATYLAGIAEQVTRALRACQAATFTADEPRGARASGPVVVLLSPDLATLRQTAAAAEMLHELLPPADGRDAVPAAAYNVAAQLLAVEAGVDDNPPSARAPVADGLWVTLRAARIGDAARPEDRDIAVTIEATSLPDRLSVFGRAYGFTPRERELVDLLLAGADTREVARRMFVSEHTVQDHLKSVFAKTGVRNRRTLLLRALGT